MCQYVGPMSKKETQGIQNHIQSLEARIRQLSANDTPSLTSNPTAPVQLQSVLPEDQAEEQFAPQTSYPGTMLISQEQGTSYRDPTNWQAVLDEVGRHHIPFSQGPGLTPYADLRGERISPDG